MSWTEERVDKAIELFMDGKSAGEIAQILGGLTRNAVIGKLHRLGYSRKAMAAQGLRKPQALSNAKPAKVKDAPQRRRKPKPITITIPKRELKRRSLRGEGPVELPDLGADTCRFPVTEDGPDHAFCGAKSMEGSPYCEQHHALCHEKPAKTKKRGSGRADYNPLRRAA